MHLATSNILTGLSMISCVLCEFQVDEGEPGHLLLFVCCSAPRRTLHCAARSLRRQQDTDTDQGDQIPEDKPGSQHHADKFPTCLTTAPPGGAPQVPPITLSTVTAHPASRSEAPLKTPKSCLSFYPQPPLPGRTRAGGRLGVSFCFSRRGPRLEPSAPVFSDLEEEEREKRERMKERIKGIMEDICREIAEVEGRKHEDGEKLRASCEAMPVPSESSREEGDIGKGEMVKTSSPSDNCSSDLLHRPSQSQNTQEAEKEQESERTHQDTCVLGKDGSTCLRWPASLLKFTKTQPCISYSHNPLSSCPQNTEGLRDGLQVVEQNQLPPPSGSDRIILTPHIHAPQHSEAIQHVDAETEHLCLNENISSPERRPGIRGRSPVTENSGRTCSRPVDDSQCDSSSPSSQNPQGGGLTVVTDISETAITTISPKAESVTHGICTSLSRCERRCGHAIAPELCLTVSGGSHHSGKAGVKERKMRKKKSKKEKASRKRQSGRRRVRSVVATVSTGAWRVGESAENWGKTTNRRKVQSAVTSCLLGKWEGRPISVSVRNRGPRRSNGGQSRSQAEREQRDRCRAPSQTNRGGRPDRRTAPVPWRSHISLHSLSSGCNSELFWERGHHSNPRSFIDCCYPDNRCDCSPPRKRKLLYGDRLLIHCKRRSLRHREVWEETDRSRKMRGPSGSRDRGLNADAEQWDWMRRSCPPGSRSRNEAEHWDQMATFSPSPSRWSRGSRQISTDEADWDRWTWSSSDSVEDRRTHRSTSGSRTGADSRSSPDSEGKCARTVHLRSKHFFSSDWWTSRQASNPQSVIKTQEPGGCSPGSCSPCSSTGISELSWDWSRSSTCLGPAVDGSVSPCRETSGTQGLSSKGQKEQNSPVSSGTINSSQTSPHRRPPADPGLNKHYSDQTPPQQKEPQTQCDLQGSLTPVTMSRSDGTPAVSPDKSRSQKPARVLLLPLIGKLPAIQKRAERRKALLWKSQQKERENGAEGTCVGRNVEEATDSQAESNPRSVPSLSLSEIRTTDKQAAGQTAPPISFAPEEMDKYRLLQEQAREHMQKVLEQMQEDSEAHAQPNPESRPESCRTSQLHTPATLHNPPQPQIHPVHADSAHTRPQHGLRVAPAPTHDSFPEPLVLRPLPPPASLRRLPHVILQHAAVSMPASSPSTSTLSPSAPVHAHPAQIPHPLPPSLPLPLHLSPFSLSSLFPSILLSHGPIPLLPQSPAFHVSPVGPLSAVTLQPLALQPFLDRAWPVRFQQKAL